MRNTGSAGCNDEPRPFRRSVRLYFRDCISGSCIPEEGEDWGEGAGGGEGGKKRRVRKRRRRDDVASKLTRGRERFRTPRLSAVRTKLALERGVKLVLRVKSVYRNMHE